MAATAPASSTRREVVRDVGLSILLGGVAPLLIYSLLRPHTTEVRALIVAASAPVLDNVISFARRRTFDVFGVFVLAGLVLSVILVLLGGSPRLILVRESLLTGATGLVFLLSLLYRRPLIYYFALHFSTGGDPAKIAEMSGWWQTPYFRFVMRLMTAVWGVVLAVEAAARTYLAFTLPTARFLAISPGIQWGLIGPTIAWTVWYARHARRRGEELRRQRERASGTQGVADAADGVQ